MRVSDRPGRYFALLVFAPALVVIGIRINSLFAVDAGVLIILGWILFVYEIYWVSHTVAEVAYTPTAT